MVRGPAQMCSMSTTAAAEPGGTALAKDDAERSLDTASIADSVFGSPSGRPSTAAASPPRSAVVPFRGSNVSMLPSFSA